jgi:hypothetical protein
MAVRGAGLGCGRVGGSGGYGKIEESWMSDIVNRQTHEYLIFGGVWVLLLRVVFGVVLRFLIFRDLGGVVVGELRFKLFFN